MTRHSEHYCRISRQQTALSLRTRVRIFSSTIVAAVVLLGALVVCGCSAPARPVQTDAQLQARAAAYQAEMAATLHDAITRVMNRVETEYANPSDEVPTIHFLAISGGGDRGAFGAGFLVGWGTVTDKEWRRPDFDAITGVSTGALIAPFAFVGTDEAYSTIENFYRNPRKDWVRSFGLMSYLPSRASFMTIPGLGRDVRSAFGADFVEQMAQESAKGKILAISATDLDLGRQHFWEIGKEAERAVKSGDYDHIHRILLSSAAIPGAFPPVLINESLYADGGVTANVFLRLDTQNPNAFLPRWLTAHPDKPFPRVRYWIILNNQQSQPPATVQARWPSILSPSVSTAIRFSTLSEIRWLAAEADYVNAIYKTDIEVRLVSIPDEWRPPVSGQFEKATMQSLADLGRQMGADPASWTIMAAPGEQIQSR